MSDQVKSAMTIEGYDATIDDYASIFVKDITGKVV